MIKKTNKGGLFRKRKQRSVRKFIVLGLAVMLAAFGLTILVSEQLPTVNAGVTDNRAAISGITSAGTGYGTDIQTRALIKSIGARGSVTPILNKYSVNVTVDGETKTYDFIGHATVADLIKKSGIIVAEGDELSQRLDTVIKPNDTIKVTRVTTETVEEKVETPFEVVYVDDATMTKGTTLVMQEGVNKVVNNIYTVTYHDGEEASRVLDRTDVIQEGKPKKIAQGTKEEAPAQIAQSSQESSSGTTSNSSSSSSNSSSSASSESNSQPAPEPEPAPQAPSTSSENTIAGYSYSNVITCTAFAYTAPAGALGASGKPAVEGTCAVDTSVIPMGTRLYIEGYGYAVANDIGGGIIGNTVDLFYDSYDECVSWGRRTVNVYILD